MQVNSSGNPTTGSICNSRLGVVCHWPYSSCHFQLILGLGLSIEDANVIHSAMTSNSAGRSQMPMKQIASALNDQALTNCAQLLSKNLLKICRVCLFFFFFQTITIIISVRFHSPLFLLLSGNKRRGELLFTSPRFMARFQLNKNHISMRCGGQ